MVTRKGAGAPGCLSCRRLPKMMPPMPKRRGGAVSVPDHAVIVIRGLGRHGQVQGQEGSGDAALATIS